MFSILFSENREKFLFQEDVEKLSQLSRKQFEFFDPLTIKENYCQECKIFEKERVMCDFEYPPAMYCGRCVQPCATCKLMTCDDDGIICHVCKNRACWFCGVDICCDLTICSNCVEKCGKCCGKWCSICAEVESFLCEKCEKRTCKYCYEKCKYCS